MIPLRDDNPTRSFPAVTIGLIILNVAAFVYEMSLPPDGLETLFLQMGVVPSEVTAGLRSGGPLDVWLTPLTSMFLHGGVAHLLGNMLYLWIFGNNIEDLLGRIRFLIFYVITGLGAVAGQVAASPHSGIPMVGASGAIAGVLGAYLAMFPHARVLTLVPLGFFIRIVHLPAWLMLGFWFLYQVLLSMFPGERGGGVAFFAHIGGFVSGLILIWVFRVGRAARSSRTLERFDRR